MIREIQRAAVGGSIKAARLPLDTAAALLRKEGAGVALDRADAAVRDVAGRVLFDDELLRDAHRRRAAADERERALRLRQTAVEVSEEADEQAAARERDAEQRRQAAARQAQERKRSAASRRDAEKRRAAETEKTRKRAAAETEARRQEAIEAQAKRERLEALEEKAEALEVTEDALTARDEARRLKRAASQAKAARKS
jgi:hypothetical protein